MSDSRKFKIGGTAKTLKELFQDKINAAAASNTTATYGNWGNVSGLSTKTADDYKSYEFKINKKGEMEPILSEADKGVDDITFSASKSNLRRIADIERNISILANRISTIDSEADISDSDAFDNWITEDTAFTQDVTLGRSGTSSWWGGSTTATRVDVDGHLYINNGVTFGSTAIEELQDKIGAMFSGSETGITATYNDGGNNVTFSVTSAPKWSTSRTLSLTGDVSGSVSWDGSANASLSVSVANDSHTHAFANITGKPTTLAGYGITDSLASGSHTHAFADLTSKPTTLAGYGITDSYTSTQANAAITTAINNLVDGAPAALNTLNELAAAIGDNASYAASITTALAGKVATNSAQALRATDALTVSNDTITIHKGDGTSESVSISDANTDTLQSIAATNTDATYYPSFVSSTSGAQVGYVDTNMTYNPSTNTLTTTNFAGTATYAKYADLAERYAADAPYTEGTVVVFGGEAEVTASTSFAQRSVAGVVSLRPAVAMNSEAGNNETHPYIALQGRVPVKVTGTVKKGDILVASDVAGTATAWTNEDADPRMTAYVGIAIADAVDGFVEVKVGK